MRRFRFTLQPLLRLRSQLERTSRRTMASAMTDLAAVERRLDNVRQGLVDCDGQARADDAVGRLARALAGSLQRQQWRLQTARSRAEAVLDRARVDWLSARRDLATVRKLEEKRREEWRREAIAAAQAELDELSRLARGSAAVAAETKA